jgi:hypothetical protein
MTDIIEQLDAALDDIVDCKEPWSQIRLGVLLVNAKLEIENLRKQNSDMGWKLNPGRMGGSFSEWETNRRGDEWS